jgi:hypothetical protein
MQLSIPYVEQASVPAGQVSYLWCGGRMRYIGFDLQSQSNATWLSALTPARPVVLQRKGT